MFVNNIMYTCIQYEGQNMTSHNSQLEDLLLKQLRTLHVVWCYVTLWSLQEALSEFEVVNMEGKTSEALTVRTRLFEKIIGK